jgi:hypothetical protein
MSAQGCECFLTRLKRVLWPLLFLLGCLPASGTTVLVILTPEGIVIAADSKVVSKDFGGYSAPPEGPANKIIVVRDRIAVGNIGFLSKHIETMDDRPLFDYDPASWPKGIEQKSSPDISVSEFIDTLGREARSKFSPLNDLLRDPTFENRQTYCESNGVQYLVAGFESGIAVVEEVNFTIDEKSCQLTGPFVQPIFPAPDTRRFDFGFHPASMGYEDAAGDVVYGRSGSDGYRSIAFESPAELWKLLAKRDMSLKQASRLLHSILRAQNKYTPAVVGPPYTVVRLRKDGALSRFSYRD